MAKRWTKADIRRLTGQLDTAWLYARPLQPAHGGRPDGREAFRTWLATGDNRTRVVLQGLGGWERRSAGRAQQNRDTAQHARTSGVWGSSTEEMVQRFERLAAADTKDVQLVQRLVARVKAEGLPPEVVAYDPTVPQ